jgi:hypothetical protein
MGQRRAEQHWPRPKQTRHVWIKGPDKFTPPTQGFVVAWRRQSYRWAGLVVHVVDDRMLMEWMPADQLAPVRPTPPDFFDFY